MIAADSSALARLWDGHVDRSTAAVRAAVTAGDLHLPPVAVTELLSNPRITHAAIRFVASLPLLRITDGYWERAGELRRKLLAARVKANLADCLIAQSCTDNDIPLITYDRDFRHFAPAGLKLA